MIDRIKLLNGEFTLIDNDAILCRKNFEGGVFLS